jgi:hypothetical protein
MRHEAIRVIHPTVVTIDGDEWGKLQAWDANGADVAIDQAAVDNKAVELVAAHATAVAAEVASKANAKSKLAALGLSEDEISAAFGI